MISLRGLSATLLAVAGPFVAGPLVVGPLAAAPLGAQSVMGALTDSIHARPLAGATVSVVGTALSTTSGADGAFRFDAVPSGTYTLAATHPLLDTLGLSVTSRAITVVEGRTVAIGLATPSAGSVRRTLCARADTVAMPGLLVGRLRDADTDAPAVGAHVALVYGELQVSAAAGVHRIMRLRQATVGADGRYAICGLPAKFRGTVQATRGADATAEVPLSMNGVSGMNGAFLALRSMTIGLAHAAAATITGRVVDAAGNPLAGAQATVTGAPSTATGATAPGAPASASTTDRGEFSLQSLPTGTRELVVRKVGYEPATVAVELTSREPRRLVVTLVAAAPTLPVVQVMGVMEAGLTRAGFFDRKAMGMGYYVTPAMIDSLRPRAMTDLLNTAPGIQVSTTDWGTNIQSTRTTAAQKDACVTVFVDRVPWSAINPGDLDTAFPVADVAAIEVYGGIAVPSEFTQIGKSCATIVVWTRTGVGKR